MGEVRGEVVVPVGVDALQPAAHVEALVGHLDADAAQLLADVLGLADPFLAVGPEVLGQCEAHIVVAARVAGLVEQRLGGLRVVRERLQGGIEMVGVAADRGAAGRRAVAVPDDVDQPLAVDRHADRLAHPFVR